MINLLFKGDNKNMNRKIYYDEFGKITVYNEEALSKKREYQDNIEDVLSLENIIEGLFQEYDDYKNQASNFAKKRRQIKGKIKKHSKSRILWLIIQLIIVPIISIIFFNIIDFIVFTKILIFLGAEGLAFLGTMTFGHLYQDLKNYHVINELTEKINGSTIALKAAKKLIEKKEKELENLNNDKSTLLIEEHKNLVKEIDYKDKLLKLKTYLMRMYRYGTNDDYYQKIIHHEDLFDKMYKKHEEELGNTRKRDLNLEKEAEKRKRNTVY